MRGHFLTRTLFRGIGVVVPLALSVYILIWVVGGIESVLHDLLSYVLPPGYYVPGMGFALLLLIIFFAGLLMYPWLTRSLVTRTDDMLREIPLFGSIYSPIKDFAKLFGGDIQQELGQPVMVTIPGSGMEMLGFITREDGKGLPEGFLPDDHVVVFVQWSMQLGGYCFIVPRAQIREVDMRVEAGMRWALSAGLSAQKGSDAGQ